MCCLMVSLMPWDTEGACNAHPMTRPQTSEVPGILTAASTNRDRITLDV